MKTLFVLPLAAVILAGCAAPPPRYAQRPVNPYDWHTVSVTPVQPGTVSAQGGRTEYTTEPAPVYVQQPVYIEQPVYPVYAPAPAYYYPPVSIGLDFVFTNRRGGGWWRGRHR
jgi:hypothetical protein